MLLLRQQMRCYLTACLRDGVNADVCYDLFTAEVWEHVMLLGFDSMFLLSVEWPTKCSLVKCA